MPTARICSLVLTLTLMTKVNLNGQDEFPTRPIRLVTTNAQDDSPTLPPLEVRPPDDSDQSGSGDDETPTLPPVEVQPPAPSNVTGDIPSIASELSAAYPSLSEQIFGTLDGGTRGAPLSVFDNPRAIEILRQEQIRERSPADIGQALEQTTGIMIQRTGRGQSSPFIRGLTGNQVLILVDGVRLTNATFRAGPNQYFNTIDPNMVERIEVTRGPGSVLYGGDALGGVINVVTKKSNLTGYDWVSGTTVQRFSSTDLGYSGRLNVEGSVGSAGVFAGAGYGTFNNLDIGGAPDAPQGFDPRRQPATSWGYSSADIKLNYALTPYDELVFGFQHYQGEDIFRTDRFPQDRETIFDPQQRDMAFVRLQGASLEAAVNRYQITGSFQRTKEGTIDSRPIGTLDAIREFTDEQTGFNAVFGSDMGSYGWLTYGADWYHDEIDASIINPDTDNDMPQFPNDAWYSRYGVFAQLDIPLSERLQVNGGVRYEHVTSGATLTVNNASTRIDPEYQGWIGQGGITYQVTPEFNLVGSISEGFRAPNLDDLVAVNSNVFVGTQLPNPNLAPERSISYELGGKLNTDVLRTEAFVWWTDLNDHILRGPPNTMNLLERSNKDSYLHGVELSAELLLPNLWSLYGNFWYTYGQDTVDNVPLSRIPPAQGVLGLRRRWNQSNEWIDFFAWSASRQDRLSPRDLTDTRRIPSTGTPGYTTLNFRYGRMLDERQRISLSVENLFDEQYRVHGSGSDAPGINAIVSYELLR